jgi:Predicted membrane protein
VATYITAVYGAIIGADVLNMKKVLRHRPPFVSIGGAGVFDGIFLSGVLAVLLSRLF